MSNKDEEALVAAMKQHEEKLQQLWKEAENRLKKFQLPRVVVVVFEESSEECLAWARPAKCWRLCYGYIKYPGSDAPWWFEPIDEVSMDLRLDCIPCYKHLVVEMVKSARDMMVSLDVSIKALSEQLSQGL